MPHIHDKADVTVEVFVVYDGKVLLRKHDKYKLWLSVGGHMEIGEDPEQAALREVKEEVGLDVVLFGERPIVANEGEGGYHELLPPRFAYRHAISATHDHITFVYGARAASDVIQNAGRESSEDVRWFSAGELSDPTFDVEDGVRYHALQILADAALFQSKNAL